MYIYIYIAEISGDCFLISHIMTTWCLKYKRIWEQINLSTQGKLKLKYYKKILK